MPNVLQILRLRQARPRPAGWLGLGCSGLVSLVAVLGSLALALGYANLIRGLPSPDILPALLDPPRGQLLQPTRLYDRTGAHLLLALENPAISQRQFLHINELPPALIEATLASADPSFWRHPGFSLAGISSGTHPTLAQRLVSDLILWDEPTGLRRSLHERLLAAVVTARFGRERVLEWYLNSAEYGQLTYGVEAAAQRYFGKSARELNLAESAFLAARAQAPGLDPYAEPDKAQQKTTLVLQAMQTGSKISPTEVGEALSQDLVFTAPAQPSHSPANDFLSLVLDQLASKYNFPHLARGGLRVITTLDNDLQTQVNCGASSLLARMERKNQSVDPCPAADLLPALPVGQDQASAGLEAEAVILDPQSGQVLALGDVHGEEAGVPANDSRGTSPPGRTIPGASLGLYPLVSHPTGSLLTPFIYFTALTRDWSPASQVWDIPRADSQEGLAGFEGPIRLRLALANDRLSPANQLLSTIGQENVEQAAAQFGLGAIGEFQEPAGLLEKGKATLLQAALAYGVFANQGVAIGTSQQEQSAPAQLDPITVLRIEDLAGGLVWDGSANQRRSVTSPQLAYLVNNMLSDETARWPSLGHPNSLEIGRPAAAKLGWIPGEKDTWAVGYTPNRVVGAWVGYAKELSEENPQPAPLHLETAALLWHALIQYTSQDTIPQGWTPPPGITTLDVCDRSGGLPTPDCPAVVSEVFLDGSEPSHPDTLYRRIAINRETGRLASVFTPLERVEERVYLNIPPEAAEWAKAAALPVPPNTYDVIFGPQSSSAEAQILSPEMFAWVHGQVPVSGTAAGEDFKGYRLQAGEGLYPRSWIAVGPEVSQPVQDEELAEWDTRGLEGPVVLQLLVIRSDNRVDTAAIQVTVDNQPPKLNIPYPHEGQVFEDTEYDLITFQAEVSDNLGLQQVEFLVDGDKVGTQVQAPFAFPWQPVKGEHNLLVKATDRAGNTTEAQVKFVVE